MFTLNIITNTFEDYTTRQELADVLRKLADRVEGGHVSHGVGNCWDVNGNEIGEWRWTPDDTNNNEGDRT